ncbi:MAG TPA: hypothetical protein VFV66_19920 [Nonomuraea sp.]|nr:hypothetical protein [Nonomuraea sp.]
MVGGRMLMEASAVDVELLALKKRVSELEEQVRMLNAANLALVGVMEKLSEQVHLTQPDKELTPAG